jgi:aspartyl-tRNA(Asn)/glutamyl-tRNA(Gln) amidotransferase subunit C
MALTKEEVLHMAALCRIALSPQEVEFLRGQLSDILEHVRTLQEVDTEGVLPTSHSAGLTTVMRDDSVSDGLSSESTLANAPFREKKFFRVNAVLEE